VSLADRILDIECELLLDSSKTSAETSVGQANRIVEASMRCFLRDWRTLCYHAGRRADRWPCASASGEPKISLGEIGTVPEKPWSQPARRQRIIEA